MNPFRWLRLWWLARGHWPDDWSDCERVGVTCEICEFKHAQWAKKTNKLLTRILKDEARDFPRARLIERS